MPRSGETCKVFGLYSSDCSCRARVTLAKGDRFPECPRCHWVVEWTLDKKF
ncbi:MAG: hypothetical protein HY722_06710 [Planctomycetes bacterium]|nr:hypothetical protein [Planctomycetota bacterium]